MNFATLQGLTIPEGNVTQITDASGRVIWALETDKPATLQVEKVVSNTYAGETTYENEEFIVLDIYPKPNKTVKVTYGGLTKTITDTSGAAEPNAQQVFFGTFNGVSDSVTTPASGELTIEGGYRSFGVGNCGVSKGANTYAGGITAVIDWGNVTDYIQEYAFASCSNLTSITIPDSVMEIGSRAFTGCKSLTSINIPGGVTLINNGTFYNCSSLTSINMPDGITSIGNYAFYGCSALSSISSIQCETIGEEAFYGCLKLSSIPLAEGVISISESAFSLGSAADMESLSPMNNGAITIPSTVQSIGIKAFSTTNDSSSTTQENVNQRYLTEVYILPTTPPLEDGVLLENVFGYATSSCKMIVPKGCIEAYKAVAGYSWNKYITEAS